MSWNIQPNADGTWDWSCAQSAFGAAAGSAPSLAQAKVELAIAEADVINCPYPPEVVKVMLADPERFAADMPLPPPPPLQDDPSIIEWFGQDPE